MAYSQDTRIGKLEVDGDADLLALVRFTATEAISEPFVFVVEGLSEDKPNIDFEKKIGAPVTVSIKTTGEDTRYFSGLLAESSRGDDTNAGHLYRLVVRPHLYFLTKRIASRVFAEKDVIEVVSEVLDEHGVKFLDRTTRTYPKFEYLVQHRESDFNFISRLLEAHGISYHHKFDGGHVLHLCDTDRQPLPGSAGKKRRLLFGERQLREEEALYEWLSMRSHTTGSVANRDYDFIKPTKTYENKVESDASFALSPMEDYVPLFSQHLAEKITDGFGKDYAQYRLDAHRSLDNNFSASGDAPGLTPGFVMALENHPSDDGEYVVVRAVHTLSHQGYRSGETVGAQYSGNYVLYPLKPDKPWTPLPRTPKPLVSGIETAVVIADQDKDVEIDVDKYGRILVQFHWNKGSEKYQSMRCRVAQMWAGNLWGTQYIPRRGMEVIVSFIDGDPDRPLVTGTVYNADNMPPYKMPAEKNISGIKSRSTEKASGYNEMAFDDTKGEELVRFHAQKDYETKILNDEKREIEHDRVTTIKHDETLTVTNNILIEAKNSLTLKVGKSVIYMDQKTITIDSPEIKITALANLESHSNMLAKHTSGGPMTIKGMPVLIN